MEFCGWLIGLKERASQRKCVKFLSGWLKDAVIRQSRNVLRKCKLGKMVKRLNMMRCLKHTKDALPSWEFVSRT